MIVVIGSDNTGVRLKDLLIKHLKQQDYEVGMPRMIKSWIL